MCFSPTAPHHKVGLLTPFFTLLPTSNSLPCQVPRCIFLKVITHSLRHCTDLKAVWFARDLWKTPNNLVYSPRTCRLFTKGNSFISPEIRLKGHSLQEALPNLPPHPPSRIIYITLSPSSSIVSFVFSFDRVIPHLLICPCHYRFFVFYPKPVESNVLWNSELFKF